MCHNMLMTQRDKRFAYEPHNATVHQVPQYLNKIRCVCVCLCRALECIDPKTFFYKADINFQRPR
jgi:hypothetical protein